MAGTIPAINPFPAQPTVVIDEGPFIESYRVWKEKTPTFSTEPFRRLVSIVGRYRYSFDAAGEAPVGQAVYVYGEHGSGKTHSIRAAVGDVCAGGHGAVALPLYAKMDGPDLLATYRLLMAQIDADDLTEIAWRFLGSFSSGGPFDSQTRELIERDPSTLLEMFDKHLLERGVLLEAQAERLSKVVHDESNFQRALTYLLEPDLRDTAFRWIQGVEVRQSELDRLGISGPIQTAHHCRYGLQLLTLLCVSARRPLILMLDQAEKYLINTNGVVIAESVGMLHSLSESIRDIGGMLVVASSDEAWQRLPKDLRQRFGVNDVECPSLEPEDANELVGVYVRMQLEPSEQAGYSPPDPFTNAAMRQLLHASGGNQREFLLRAWQSFDSLPQGTTSIDADLVPEHPPTLDRNIVEQVVKRAVWSIGPVRFAPEDRFQFSVPLGNRTNLLVRITQSIFYVDETARAEEDLIARLKAGRDRAADRYVLVIVGYASSEVLELLGCVFDDVLVYRDELAFSNAFDKIAHAGRTRPRRTTKEMGAIINAIAQLGSDRVVHSGRLVQTISEMSLGRQSRKVAARFEELTLRWQSTHEDLASEIGKARRERVAAELEELHVIHRLSQSRGAGLNGILSLLFLAVAVTAAFVTRYETAAVFGLLALHRLVVVARHRMLGQTPQARSLAEAERIARERIRRPVPPLGSLRSRDPYHRLGFLVLVREDIPRARLLDALGGERVGMVRRLIADRLGRQLSHESWQSAMDTVDVGLRELPYLMQHQRVPKWSETEGAPAPLRLLLGLVGRLSVGDPDGDSTSIPAQKDSERHRRFNADIGVGHVLRTYAGEGALGDAYFSGIDHDRFVKACAEATASQMKLIERLLSPHEGLGCYDHLELAPEIEELYLFYRKLNYLRDGGALWN